jgi:hypothetical protein
VSRVAGCVQNRGLRGLRLPKRACFVNTQLQGQQRMVGDRQQRNPSTQMSGSRIIEPDGIQTRRVWVVVWAAGVVVGLFTVPPALCCHRGTCMSGASTCRDGSRPANELRQKQGLRIITNIAIAPSSRRLWFGIASITLANASRHTNTSTTPSVVERG